MSDIENNEEVKTEKKPISEARRAALAKARERANEVRRENKLLRDKEKAANLEIARKALADNKERIENLDKRARGEVEEEVDVEKDDESEPEEIVEERIVKKKKKSKKPIRRRVVVVEESSEEDEEQEEITSVTIPKTKAPDPMARMSERMFSL